ncbi:hypothetical protein MARCHEWKA_05700 [Brevundimonas phage vB_BpoS-Marchewka]|uniref:Putative DnaT-like domain-containing protein n=1 Tax=Brevundimonas phage vB_BpoS-Marchewka TaxID=2948604 RepID=A0A9E7N3B7_9CAUD|nr:hypothetical protein MARCHEWKA_05700 [Brevundimonas phage vB_BpoS-Marchewka]
MAFNFVVEDGLGDPQANSYCTVEFADDYIEANGHISADWLDQEEEDKQRLLVRASKVLDIRFKWHGTRVEPDSGLAWPRAGVTLDGVMIPDNVIPRLLKEATAEFAAYLMTSDWTRANADGGSGEFSEIKVDVIQVKFKDSGEREGVMPEFLLAMLEDLGAAKTGRRPGFKRIVRT